VCVLKHNYYLIYAEFKHLIKEQKNILRTSDVVNLAFERCQGHAANFVRFVERPILNAKVTFISDSDVLILYPSDQVVFFCLRHMEALGLPYSNILRP